MLSQRVIPPCLAATAAAFACRAWLCAPVVFVVCLCVFCVILAVCSMHGSGVCVSLQIPIEHIITLA